MVTVMCIPNGFRIKKKSDTETFIKKCMISGNKYYIKTNKEEAIYLSKDVNGNVSIYIKTGDLADIFNPLLEVARIDNNCYNKTVEDYIWHYRKYINAQWFNKKL